MAHQIAPLVHTPNATDEVLVGEEMGHFTKHSSIQVVCELHEDLRVLSPGWLPPTLLRERKSALERLKALEFRPDLRQAIIIEITGLPKNTARKMPLERQAALIDDIVDNGDCPIEKFESAFPSQIVAVYMDPAFYWRLFMEKMTWAENDKLNQQVMAKVLNALLKERSSGRILTEHDVLSRIQRSVWRSRLPAKLQEEIDERLLKLEEEASELTFSEGTFQVAPPDVFVEFIPPDDLVHVMKFAEEKMGFAPEPTLSEKPPALTPEVASDANGSNGSEKPDAPSDPDSATPDVLKLDDPLSTSSAESSPKA